MLFLHLFNHPLKKSGEKKSVTNIQHLRTAPERGGAKLQNELCCTQVSILVPSKCQGHSRCHINVCGMRD